VWQERAKKKKRSSTGEKLQIGCIIDNLLRRESSEKLEKKRLFVWLEKYKNYNQHNRHSADHPVSALEIKKQFFETFISRIVNYVTSEPDFSRSAHKFLIATEFQVRRLMSFELERNLNLSFGLSGQ
jgi:hypothetical protein